MLPVSGKNRLALLASVLLLSFSAADVQAVDRERNPKLPSEEKMESELRKSQYRKGRFFILTGLELGDLSIDDDLYLPAEEEGDDLTMKISLPTRIFWAPSRKFVISTDVEPQFVWFLNDSDASDFHWRLRADTHFLFNRLYMDFYAETSDLLVRETSELRALVQQDTFNFGADTEWMISSRTSGEFDVRMNDLDYVGARRSEINEITTRLEREEVSWTAKIRHQTFPVTAVSLGTTQTEHDFDLFPERDASTSEYFVELDRDRRKTSMQLRLGHAKLDYDDPNRLDFSGFVGSGTWSVELRRRWSLSISGRRSIQFSTFEENDHYTEDRISVTNSLQITNRLSGFVTVETGQNEYFLETDLTPAHVPEKRIDDLYFLAIGADLRVIGRFGVGATLSSWERDSNVAGLDDDGIRLILRLSLGPTS